MEYPSFRPRYGEFELIGDSLMVRFAFHNRLGPQGIEWARRLGLCISGITVEGLINEILKVGVQSSKVMVLVGTNDILKAMHMESPRHYLNSVRGNYEHLKKLLHKLCEKIIFLTIPLIPRLQHRQPQYLPKLERLNRMILNWDNIDPIMVLPLHKVMSISECEADSQLYESDFRAPQGRCPKEDGVHLNRQGNRVFAVFLESVLSTTHPENCK